MSNDTCNGTPYTLISCIFIIKLYLQKLQHLYEFYAFMLKHVKHNFSRLINETHQYTARHEFSYRAGPVVKTQRVNVELRSRE